MLHLLFWLVITLFFLYDRRYLIEKAGLDHFILCVVARLSLIITLAYLNLYYLIPKFFLLRKYLQYTALLVTAVLCYVTLQNLFDIYLYGYVIGDIKSKKFFTAMPYNAIVTCWYLLLTVGLKLSLDPYRYSTEKGKTELNRKPSSESQFIFLKSGTRQVKTNLDDIIYIEGMKDYSVVVTQKEKIIIKGSLKTVAAQFSGLKKLIRVHKSYLVPEDKIRVVKSGNIVLGDQVIPVGRMYKKDLEAVISG